MRTDIPAWVVSAAILLQENKPLSTKELVDKVMRTSLSGLGLKGSRPEATLPVQLLNKSKIRFIVDRGIITLYSRQSAIDNSRVQRVLETFETIDYDLIDTQNMKDLRYALNGLMIRPKTPKTLRQIRRFITAYERPKSITDYVKRMREPIATCQLCNELGFVKRDGERYCEVHHLFQLSKQPPADCLSPEYLVILCGSCHRRMHYANVGEPKRTNDGWIVCIDEKEHYFVTQQRSLCH